MIHQGGFCRTVLQPQVLNAAGVIPFEFNAKELGNNFTAHWNRRSDQPDEPFGQFPFWKGILVPKMFYQQGGNFFMSQDLIEQQMTPAGFRQEPCLNMSLGNLSYIHNRIVEGCCTKGHASICEFYQHINRLKILPF